jgi:hypothetical protein
LCPCVFFLLPVLSSSFLCISPSTSLTLVINGVSLVVALIWLRGLARSSRIFFA